MRRFVAIVLSSTLVFQAAPLMAGPAKPGIRAGGVQAPAPTATINGTAQGAAGQTLPNYTVQLRSLQTGRLAGLTRSDAGGSFSFAGLSPGNYIIEIVDQVGVIVGSSATIAVAAGATVTVSVTAMAAAAIAGASAAAAGGISTTLLVVTASAAAAGIAGVVVVVGDDASPSR